MDFTIRSNGGKPMPESEAKTRWMRENTVMMSVKLMNKSDADIIEYLEGKSKATIVKKALRLLMAQEGFVYTPPSENTDEGE